jgi:hypothetical protein
MGKKGKKGLAALEEVKQELDADEAKKLRADLKKVEKVIKTSVKEAQELLAESREAINRRNHALVAKGQWDHMVHVMSNDPESSLYSLLGEYAAQKAELDSPSWEKDGVTITKAPPTAPERKKLEAVTVKIADAVYSIKQYYAGLHNLTPEEVEDLIRAESVAWKQAKA